MVATLLLPACEDGAGERATPRASDHPSVTKSAADPAGSPSSGPAEPCGPKAVPRDEPTGTLPPGVSLSPADGGRNYYARWTCGFPVDPGFFPIGAWPASSVAGLKSIGVNFTAPMRDDRRGLWRPVWDNGEPTDMSSVVATPGFYAGGSFYLTEGERPWGNRAAFEMFGDELDGTCSHWVDNLPPSLAAIRADAMAGTPGVCRNGGLSPHAFLRAEAASRHADPTRPTYLQVTGTYLDLYHHFQYTAREKEDICGGADILSFDRYPLVYDLGPVSMIYDYVKEARDYCRAKRPIYAFIETDTMDDRNIYPTPDQTVAEVWNALIAGARGIEYFDMFKHLSDPTYTGGGHYREGAMYDAVSALNERILKLAPVLNDDFADGYVSATGDMSVMAKYSGGHFYIFAIPHAAGRQDVTFTLAGAPDATATVLDEDRAIDVTGGTFTDTFANENEVHVYRID